MVNTNTFEIEKLHQMLSEAKIPHCYYITFWCGKVIEYPSRAEGIYHCFQFPGSKDAKLGISTIILGIRGESIYSAEQLFEKIKKHYQEHLTKYKYYDIIDLTREREETK
jgi:hypothetical protein